MDRKQDNSDLRSKLMILQEALKIIGGPSSAKVLDLFAGKGVMRKKAWADVAAYLGCDKKYSRPDCLRGDNMRLIDHMMTMDSWNVFDLDAWANPWPLASRIASILPGGRFVFVLTCSQQRALTGSTGGTFLRLTAGYPAHWDCRMLFRFYADLVKWQVASWPVKIKSLAYKRKDTEAHQTFYWLIDLEKTPKQARIIPPCPPNHKPLPLPILSPLSPVLGHPTEPTS
jgi:hypothetical protein